MPNALNLDASSRGGGGVGFLNDGGFGEDILSATRCECKLASAIELTESVRALVGCPGAKLAPCWLATGDTN